MTPTLITNDQNPIVIGLKNLLSQHTDKRVIVVGTTCTGKSTMLATIPNARDQDTEVFARMTREESDYVCQAPWTPEIGETMTRLVRQYVQASIGKPVFGTVVVDCDLIILLKISDDLLRERTQQRSANFADAKNMQRQLHKSVASSGI